MVSSFAYPSCRALYQIVLPATHYRYCGRSVTTAQAFDLTHVFNKTIASRVGHHESWFLSFGIMGCASAVLVHELTSYCKLLGMAGSASEVGLNYEAVAVLH